MFSIDFNRMKLEETEELCRKIKRIEICPYRLTKDKLSIYFKGLKIYRP